MKLLKIIAAVVLSIALIASGSAALGVFSVDRAVSEDSVSKAITETEIVQELTNEEILKDECAGILSRQAFCQLYSKLLLWETDASEPCSIRQIFSSSFGPY